MKPQPGPRFSIAVPAYNASETIEEAIESVLSQTYADWELVVMDDGSDDDTYARAMRYAAEEPRIAVYQKAHAGQGAAKRAAIARTSGDFVVHFDADDMMLPHCLKTYATFIEKNHGYVIYSCNAERFGREGEETPLLSGPSSMQAHEFELKDMIMENCVLSVAAVFPRAEYDRVGGMRPDAYADDYDLWLRLLASGGRAVYIPQILGRYRQSAGQVSSDLGRLYDGTAESLLYLAASGCLDAETTELANVRAEHFLVVARSCRTYARREALERRLVLGDHRGARKELWDTRLAHPNAAKYVLALAVTLVTPRIYASWLRRYSPAGQADRTQ